MPRKRAEDSHRVETEAERKARKEHEVESHLAGAVATGDKGRQMDEEHNRKPSVSAVREIAEFLAEVAEEMESEEGEVEDISTEDGAGEELEDKGLGEEFVAELNADSEIENETYSIEDEIADLKAKIAELEKEG